MGRAPCCEKDNVKRGPWTPEEDAKLLACIAQHGTGSWRTLPKKAGLQRCGKSCRLRWTNYLRPDLKHGRFTDHEEKLIVNLHAALGSRWSLIAAQLPGRTDNDVKNYWNTRLKKKLCEMGIDPITHKPISQLLADLAGSIALPKGGEIAEAALGCFKDDMLNVLMRKRPDWQQQLPSCSTSHNNNNNNNKTHDHVLTNYEMEPWSPSMASGSSCSSTSLMAAGAAGAADSTGLQKVLNSDVFLWDFSELSSIMN
ncbi:hypothetical protein BDL97_11G049700 [Sphagnum fallax]|nr:hypothetical protein BDL97_11G049700 [Sphagnum fallax]